MNKKYEKRRLKESPRGVTLIALVLSIVAMVIMAGASVSVITGDDGLMAKAIRAENQKKMGEHEEKIKLAAINAKSEINLEGNIKDKFIEKLEDMCFTVLTPEEDAELQANQIKVVTEDGFEFIYSINDSADIVLLDQRINGKPCATLTLEQVGMEGTANEAIKIRATTIIAEDGQITLLECLEIQTDDPNDKTGKKENPDPVVEFTVPSSGTYTVRATTKDGNTTTKRITIAINTISNKITITPSTTSPRNTGEAGEQNGIAKGPVTLTIGYEETELTKQYKKYGDENWTNVTGTSKTISVTANETYVARYYDGKNGYNQESYNVVNVDNVAPTFTASNVVALAEGVNVTVTITDSATDEASANASNTTAGILRYEYRLEDGTTGSTEPSVLTKTLTSSKLGEQKVYVKAIDKAGNETEVEKTVTVTVSNTTMNITASPLTPRNTIGSGNVNGVEQGPITLTINYGTTSFTKQYKKEGDTNWTDVTENSVDISVTENCGYVARYWDGTTGRETATYYITNVDNTNPTFENSYISVTANQGTITATVNTDATDSSGIIKYQYKLDSGDYVTGTTDLSKTKTYTNNTSGSHTVYVKAIDSAGNETVVNKAVTVTLLSVTTNTSHSTTRNLTTAGISWSKLSELADDISNKNTVTNDTMEVTITDGSGTYVLGIGDTATVKYSGTVKTVRIIGFNHDTLASNSSKKAGITFDFEDFMVDSYYMNSDRYNTNGWGKPCDMKTILNGTYLTNLKDNNSVAMSTYIKPVKKKYLQSYSSTSSSNVKESTDSLWLLSCSEIWNNGYNGSGTYGYCKQKEGDQYKYYKNINATYSSNNTSLVKHNSSGSANYWWLRSPGYNSSSYFCYVTSNGYCSNNGARYSYGVSPGFAI